MTYEAFVAVYEAYWPDARWLRAPGMVGLVRDLLADADPAAVGGVLREMATRVERPPRLADITAVLRDRPGTWRTAQPEDSLPRRCPCGDVGLMFRQLGKLWYARVCPWCGSRAAPGHWGRILPPADQDGTWGPFSATPGADQPRGGFTDWDTDRGPSRTSWIHDAAHNTLAERRFSDPKAPADCWCGWGLDDYHPDPEARREEVPF